MNHEMIEQIVQAVKEKALLVNEDSETGFYCITIDKYGIESALATLPETEPPAIDLREVEKLVQHSAYTDAYNAVCGELGMLIQDNTFDDRINAVRDEIVKHQRKAIGYTLSHLEAKEGRG